MPWYLKTEESDHNSIHVIVLGKDSKTVKEYDADDYYIDHLYELLNSEGIYCTDDGWMTTKETQNEL